MNNEIDDIRSWAYLSLYFSEKLRGGTALQYYRVQGNENKKTESIQHLEKALDYWQEVVNITSKYFDGMPLLHFGDRYNNGGDLRRLSIFSWANLTDEVRNDIEIAQESVPGKDL